LHLFPADNSKVIIFQDNKTVNLARQNYDKSDHYQKTTVILAGYVYHTEHLQSIGQSTLSSNGNHSLSSLTDKRFRNTTNTIQTLRPDMIDDPINLLYIFYHDPFVLPKIFSNDSLFLYICLLHSKGFEFQNAAPSNIFTDFLSSDELQNMVREANPYFAMNQKVFHYFYLLNMVIQMYKSQYSINSFLNYLKNLFFNTIGVWDGFMKMNLKLIKILLDSDPSNYDFKIKGDYFRYLAELHAPGDDYSSNADWTMNCYESAMMNITSELTQADHLYIRFILNHCVFLDSKVTRGPN
jgi:hypothetical protein